MTLEKCPTTLRTRCRVAIGQAKFLDEDWDKRVLTMASEENATALRGALGMQRTFACGGLLNIPRGTAQGLKKST